MQDIVQPHIRKVALRYLTTVAATLRPSTVELRADSLVTFAEYLAAHHPAVHSLTQLTREHLEDFLAYNHGRPWRGRVARDRPVSPVVSKRTVIDLRCFLDDLAMWGWAERAPGRLLFRTHRPCRLRGGDEQGPHPADPHHRRAAATGSGSVARQASRRPVCGVAQRRPAPAGGRLVR